MKDKYCWQEEQGYENFADAIDGAIGMGMSYDKTPPREYIDGLDDKYTVEDFHGKMFYVDTRPCGDGNWGLHEHGKRVGEQIFKDFTCRGRGKIARLGIGESIVVAFFGAFAVPYLGKITRTK